MKTRLAQVTHFYACISLHLIPQSFARIPPFSSVFSCLQLFSVDPFIMRSSFRSLCSPPLPSAHADDNHKLARLTTGRINADHGCADSRSSVPPNAASDGSEICIVIESPENCAGHRGHGFFFRQSSSASNRRSLRWLPLFRHVGSTASLLPSSPRWRRCRRWARWCMSWYFLLFCAILFFMVL